MTRFDIAAVGVIAATTLLITLDMGPAVAQTEANRCSAVSSDAGISIIMDTPVDLVGGGPGGGPHVLARVDVAPSVDATARHHFTVKLTNANASVHRRGADVGLGCPVQSTRLSSSPASSCSISGEPPNQTLSARILLPAVQKREASAPSLSERGSASSVSHSHEVSVVPRSQVSSGEVRIPCDQPTARKGGDPRTGYDLAVSKKV